MLEGVLMRGVLVVGMVLMAAGVGQVSGQAGERAGGRLLVVEKGAQSLGIVDPVAGKVIASVSEGKLPGRDTGHEVAVSRDGRLAYVPIYGDSGVGKPGSDGRTMVVVDVAVQKIVHTVDFGHPLRPHLPVLGPATKAFPEGILYVTTELDKTITVIDPKTLAIVGTVPTGSEQSHMLAVSRDGKWGYTANVGFGTVSVLDLAGRKLVTVIPVAKVVQRISVSMDDKWVFTSDQKEPRLAVIDAKAHTVSRFVTMPSAGYGSAPTADGRWLLVAMQDVNQVAVVDLKSWTVARVVDTGAGSHPQAVVMQPDGKTAWVSCDLTGEVVEVDLASWKVVKRVAVGKLADGMVWGKG